jgi:hypothetical protein
LPSLVLALIELWTPLQGLGQKALYSAASKSSSILRRIKEHLFSQGKHASKLTAELAQAIMHDSKLCQETARLNECGWNEFINSSSAGAARFNDVAARVALGHC